MNNAESINGFGIDQKERVRKIERKRWLCKINRFCLFFSLFTLVLLVESIGATYIVSTAQAIERQFQIPSKISGLMVSASDLAYIPTVIFISYFGSKGNRAKWIGAGTLTTAFSHLLISSSNFIFPAVHQSSNYTEIRNRLAPSKSLLNGNVSIKNLLEYEPLAEQIDMQTLGLSFGNDKFMMAVAKTSNMSIEDPMNWIDDTYNIGGSQLMKIMGQVSMNENNPNTQIVDLLKQFVSTRINQTDSDFETIKRGANAPFAFCSRLTNDLRSIISVAKAKCLDGSLNEYPLIVLFTGLIGFGIGRTMPWSLGIPMVDDNVEGKRLPSFFAGINFVRIMGPVLGFVIGSICSKFYYTLSPPAGLSPKDPTWISAWWMGYLFIGLLLLGPSILLYFFPVSTKSSKVSQIAKSSDMPMTNGSTSEKTKLSLFDRHQNVEGEQTFRQKYKTFRGAYAEILRSKLFIGVMAGRVLDLLALRGYMVFMPKYLENQFGIPQYNVNLLMASFGVFGFAFGTVSGGLIVRRFKLNGRRIAIFVLALSSVNVIGSIVKGFIGCYSTVNAVGAHQMTNDYNYTNECNVQCACGSAPLFPVCDQGGYVFYSPCHAGCRHVRVVEEREHELEFRSCQCRPGQVLSKKNCQNNCQSASNWFFVIVLLSAFAGGNCLVPGMLILLRSVPSQHRSIALGLQGFSVSLLASLPSPFIWGVIVDTACLVWTSTCPGTKGSCAIYEPTLFRQRLHFTYAILRSISLLADLYVVKQAANLDILDQKTTTTKNPIQMRQIQSNIDSVGNER